MNRKNLWLLASAIVGGSLALAPNASAQSVALQEGSIARSAGFRSSTLNPTWISRADCLADDVISFPLTVSSYANYQLEVWVGGASNDCRAVESRSGSNPTCWKVWQGVPTSTNVTALIHVRDIVAQNKITDSPNGPGSGTQDDCSPSTEGTSAPQAISMYFMLVDATSQEQVGGIAWPTKFDLVGPTPPGSVSTGVGDGILALSWDQSPDTDLVRYNFYCDPVPGKEGDASSVKPLGLDGGLDASLDATTDGSTGPDAALADAGTDAPVKDAGTDAPAKDAATDSASSGSSGSSCPTVVLVPGQTPDEAYYCGSGTGTSGTISGLANGVTYSVSVASVDGVGNVGKLSNIGCAAPQPTDDFYSVYRDAGGKAGGGFCSISGGAGAGGSGGPWSVGGLAVMLGLVLGRRRWS